MTETNTTTAGARTHIVRIICMIILAVFTCRADGGGFAFAKLKAPVYHGPPSTIQLPKPITRIGHARFFKGKRGL